MDVTIDWKLIGRRIQEARNQRHLTQAELGAAIGVSDSYISRVETGRVAISMNRFYTIAVALHVSESELLAGCCRELSIAGNEHTDSPEKEHMYSLINRAPLPMLKTMHIVCDALMSDADNEK